jgi:hypothetical protein
MPGLTGTVFRAIAANGPILPLVGLERSDYKVSSPDYS